MGAEIAAAFERAPRLAERVAARAGAQSAPDAIIAIARDELARMSEAERIAVLAAHPRIGADPPTLSALSRREQGSDADVATRQELDALNREYERRFGFRFVVFVHGRSKREIIPLLRSRLARSRDEELATGLDEFLEIARDRLSRQRT
jgi:2-oxo-4-hydroxy-4-carboxy--5-ureidoimidazoline (OHCU) decarboxylase